MLIPQESFNNQSVLDMYKAAYVEASMQDDGEVKADIAGVKVLRTSTRRARCSRSARCSPPGRGLRASTSSSTATA